VYAAIRREKGEAFSFPGGPSFVWEAADADLVGQVMAWAAEAPQAANETFNVTNGDVFEWRSVWPALAKTLGVNVGDDEPTSLAAYIRDDTEVWAKIVAKYGLASGDLRSFVGQGDQHADFAFAYGAPAGPVAFVSTNQASQGRFQRRGRHSGRVLRRPSVFHRSEAPSAPAKLRCVPEAAFLGDTDSRCNKRVGFRARAACGRKP
jgi:hypothetical protein